MKHYITLFIVAFMAMAATAQNNAIDNFFEDYQDDENFSMVYVSPKAFKMVAKVAEGTEGEMKELQEVIKDLKALRILRTEVNSLAKYKEATKRINTGSYEILLQARDDGQKIQFLTKDSGNIIEELLLLVGGKDEFVMLSFVGKLDLDKIANLAAKLDIDGAEHLGKLKDK